MTLGLRVLRGSGAAVLGRWALVAGASAGTGLLLLSALGWALAHPQRDSYDALVRLGWCLPPVVATVQLATAVGRVQPEGWPRTGLSAVGLGRTVVVALSAVNTAVVCAFGSLVALTVFLQLRGDVTGEPFGGVGSGMLASGRPLPLAGAATLLALVPVSAAATGAAGLRPSPEREADAPGALPWGVALTAVGLAVQIAAPKGHEMPLPSGFGTVPPPAILGWAVTTAGMMLAGPGVAYGCGRVLAVHRPGAVRLLAGRALQSEAPLVGRPLALLAATASVALSAYGVHRPVGPVTAFAACLIVTCVLITTGLAFYASARNRTPTTALLRELGGSSPLLRKALAVRAGVLVLAFTPVAVLIAALATLPTRR
jgi:hypothetical protein